MQTSFIYPPPLCSLTCHLFTPSVLRITKWVFSGGIGGCWGSEERKERSQEKVLRSLLLSPALKCPLSPGPNPYPNPTLAAPCQPSFSKLTAGSGSPGPSLTSSVLLWWQIPRLCSWQFGALAGSQGAPLLITFLTAIHSLWLETIRMPGPALAGSYITTNMWALHHYKQGPC